jgi:hypothetical protein
MNRITINDIWKQNCLARGTQRAQVMKLLGMNFQRSMLTHKFSSFFLTVNVTHNYERRKFRAHKLKTKYFLLNKNLRGQNTSQLSKSVKDKRLDRPMRLEQQKCNNSNNLNLSIVS